MPDLIPPHGGLREPVDRQVPAAEADDFRRRAASLKRVPVSDADLSTLYRLGDGGLSPLTGPMDRATFGRVLDEEVIVRNGKKYAWTIPLAFPVDQAVASALKVGQSTALWNERHGFVGTLEVRDVYPWDKPRYNKAVYGTERTDHPGARIANDDPRTHLVGGDVRVVPPAPHPEYGDVVLTPRQTRALFAKKGFKRVVAFQTR